MSLPVIISIPHAGLKIPQLARPYTNLKPIDIMDDSDEGALDIFNIESEVKSVITTDIARAIVDVNRAICDRSVDGVVKTVTIYNIPVYHHFPPVNIVEKLIDKYYIPYHKRLSESAKQEDRIIGFDCHTMAARNPPIMGANMKERPYICLSDGNGITLPKGWMSILSDCFSKSFGFQVSINNPFQGGFIAQNHSHEMPWVQVELSRKSFYSIEEKHIMFLKAVVHFCQCVR
jgi:formiminoglutamase